MIKALKKNFPAFLLTLAGAVLFVLFDALTNHTPIAEVFANRGTLGFIAVMAVADFILFCRDFS